MPTKLCLEPKCPESAIYRGRCRTHARAREAETHPNKGIYGSKRWQILRRRVLFEQPLCPCGQIATDVDHIRPIEQGGPIWDRANLQALCGPCHSAKTRQEQA
jgi:5-methylcytosine-specific restriction enzyme A